jgi:hypothetical protein
VTLSSSKSPWAIRVLTGNRKDRDTSGATLVLKAFESDVRAQVACREGTDTAPPPSKKPRLLDSDSEEADDTEEEEEEEEDDSQHSSVSGSPKQMTKSYHRRVDKVGFTKIELDGWEVGLASTKVLV